MPMIVISTSFASDKNLLREQLLFMISLYKLAIFQHVPGIGLDFLPIHSGRLDTLDVPTIIFDSPLSADNPASECSLYFSPYAKRGSN